MPEKIKCTGGITYRLNQTRPVTRHFHIFAGQFSETLFHYRQSLQTLPPHNLCQHIITTTYHLRYSSTHSWEIHTKFLKAN
jgi:hypothetical protein